MAIYGRKTRWILRIGLVLASGLGFCVLIMLRSPASGVEWDPFGLDHREFHFYVLPGTEFQVGPTYREAKSAENSLSTYLRSQPWWLAAATADERWDVVTAVMWSRERSGTAFSIRPLMQHDGFWVEWSQQHPQRAAELWPQLIQFARQGAYQEVPEMLAAAVDDDDQAWEARVATFRAFDQ